MNRNPNPSVIKIRLAVAGLAMTALIGLSGCQRADDDRTAGQKLDTAVAKTERNAAELKQDVTAAGRGASQAMGNAADSVVNTSSDIGITAAVKTRLAGDPTLSALAIDVDTSAGRVTLHGTAPDTAARSRATELARGVDGVTAVDNVLSVQAKR